ncbi:ATP-binding cassette domain-containing protein [Kiloniella sp. b19]|uniref:ATP-binding cassette domain-containing protein n=1 Tax=Kiloniella sp. GXU_MW_B19 TaxID=3141326 RepID=UPI0031DA0C38
MTSPSPTPRPTSPNRTQPRILPLRIEGLSYEKEGKTLVREISCRLEAGKRTLVLGPNGAGKSLFLRLAHGLITPTGGTIRWADTPTAQAHAMVFQRPVMLRRSVAANLDYALGLAGLDKATLRERRDEVLELTGLTALRDRQARVLSGGEQQRLALARAWSLRPQVLFLDEPTASLDPSATERIEELIETIHDSGTKIVLSTHNMRQARRLGDEILFFSEGCLCEQSPADLFFSAPQSEAAQRFLDSEYHALHR